MPDIKEIRKMLDYKNPAEHKIRMVKIMLDDVIEKEALEQPAQEPVAWMHYKDFTIVMHDVWEELLDGKDDWYPLYMEQSQSNKLQQVVIEHIKDLRKCAPALRMYKEMNQTADEVEKAANELEQALRSKNEQ